MPPASPQLHPPTRRAFLHLHTSPDCSDASPATALCFCPSQRWFWEEMEDLQHLHDQSCWDFKVSKGTEISRVSPDQVVLIPSAALDQDISVPSATVLCGCANPQPTLSQLPHQWLRSCFTFADVQQRWVHAFESWNPQKLGSCSASCLGQVLCLPSWADRTVLAILQMRRGKLKCASLAWCIGGLSKKGSGQLLRLVGGTEFF